MGQDSNESRVAVVTGGTGGLGTALIERLLRRRVRVVATYIIPEEAANFEKRFEIDDDRLALRRVDATDSTMMRELFDEIVEMWGGFHIVASLVGGWAGGRDVEETDDVRWERMLDLNLRSAIHTIGPAIPHLRKAGWGRVLVVGSRAVDESPPGQAAFNVAKAGVTALARTLASELDGSGVTANVLAPSVIDTPATRSTLPYADYVDWPTPEEIASVADFVLSEESNVMNGAIVPVYGRA